MSFRTVAVIVLALFCGLSAAVGVNLMVAKSSREPIVETEPVMVAKVTVPRGKVLSAEVAELKQWPKALIPPGVIVNYSDLKDRAALQTLMPGEPIFDAKLAARGAVGGMANLIPAGKRAYTVQTKTVNSNVAGFVLPGNLVDVLLTFRSNSNDETGGGSTTTLLQSVEVMAVGGQIEQVDSNIGSNGPQEVASVTLLVTPEEVTRLDLGQSLGMLSLALRNPNDKGETDGTPATIQSIRFGQMKPSEESVIPIAFPTAIPASDTVVAETTPPVIVAAPKEELRTSSIMTLRGQSWGRVLVHSQAAGNPAKPKP